MKCAFWGARYQGLTRTKGKKRSDGTRVKNYHCTRDGSQSNVIVASR